MTVLYLYSAVSTTKPIAVTFASVQSRMTLRHPLHNAAIPTKPIAATSALEARPTTRLIHNNAVSTLQWTEIARTCVLDRTKMTHMEDVAFCQTKQIVLVNVTVLHRISLAVAARLQIETVPEYVTDRRRMTRWEIAVWHPIRIVEEYVSDL